MNPNAKILESFARLAAEKQTVRLINDHRGIPIAYEAAVEQVQNSGVVMQVHKYQCVCLEIDRFTYIQSASLPSILKARVTNLDIVATLATLGNFEYASETIGRRNVIRVQPKDTIDVLILYGTQKIRGTLVDVSSSGIGIYMLSAYIYNPGMLRKNERIHLSLRLPNEKGILSDLRIPGSILYINREKGSFRLGISTSPDPHAQSQISQYITHRQAEILRELRVLYDTFYRLKLEGQQKP
jgi:hypothetical protein